MAYALRIVIPSFMLLAYAGATWLSFTSFFQPLTKEFAWSYTALSTAASLRSAEVGLMDMVVGFLADRFSIRRIILASSVLICIGWLILSQVNSLGVFYAAFFIIGTGGGGVGGVVLLTLMSRWFHKRLGLFTGITLAGLGFGGFAVPGVVYLLDMFGFRTVFAIFGVSALAVGGITAYFVRDWPADVGLAPDGIPLDSNEHVIQQSKIDARKEASKHDYTFRKAFSCHALWIIIYVSAATILSVMLVVTHIMPYLEHAGYSRQAASLVAMMIPGMSIGGRLAGGWLSDRIGHRKVLMLVATGQIIGLLLLLISKDTNLLIPFVLVFGFSWGGLPVARTVALRNCFGTANIGSILGLCMGFTLVGSITGPILAGRIFDATGSYSIALLIVCGFLLVSIPLLFWLKKPGL